MAIDFPDSPVNGDTFEASGKKWLYNGNVWILQGVVSQISDGSIFAAQLASNAVTTAKIAAGSVTMAKLGNDIEFTPADASVGQNKLAQGLSAITICTSGTRPSTPFVGQTIFETDTDLMKVWLGYSWSDGTLHRVSLPATYLFIGGGGGAGSDMGGGGGGGGYLTGTVSFQTGTYPVTVGGGGPGAPAGVSQPRGSNGFPTEFSTFTSLGGGGGGSEYANNDSVRNASSGSSGGGAQGNTAPGGTGTLGQGFAGASGGGSYFPGGGGGAGSVGGYRNPGASFVRAMGGHGIANDILGTLYYWAGGGGGAGYSTNAGDGGFGGGGGGAPLVSNLGLGDLNGYQPAQNGTVGSLGSQTNVPGGNGGDNTGGGGGGGSHYNVNNKGGNGGSGIVIIRYLTADGVNFNSISGGAVTTSGIYTIRTFTTTGSLVLT